MLCFSGFELYPRWVPLNTPKFKISIERVNLLVTFLAFAAIGLFNLCILETKNGFRESDEKFCGMRDFREKGGKSRSGPSFLFPDPGTCDPHTKLSSTRVQRLEK